MPDTLACLMAQAETEGATRVTVQALAEEASEMAVERVLQRLGLADGQAQSDLRELRQLLQAWRDAKRTARHALIGWAVRSVLAALLIALAVRLGLTGILGQGLGPGLGE